MLLIDSCSCVSSNDNLFSNGGFQCFGESSKYVTYRTRLHGTASASAAELQAQYEMLLATGAVLNVGAQFVSVDSSCPVVIDSFNEAECVVDTTPNMSSATTVIVAVVVCLLVVLSVIVIVLVVVFFTVRRKKTKKSVISGKNA